MSENLLALKEKVEMRGEVKREREKGVDIRKESVSGKEALKQKIRVHHIEIMFL